MKVEGLNGTGSELSPDHLSSSSETQSALLINGQDTQDCHVPGGFCPQAIDVRDTPNQEVLSTNAQRARQSRRSRKKSTPSQLRAQDAIQVINATFAACVGKHLNNETSTRSLPVHKLRKGLSLVPATLPEYRTLRKLQNKTDARRARVSFRDAASVPDYSGPVQGILVKMPSLAHEIMKDSSSAIFVALKKESWTYQGEQVKVYESGSLRCKLKLDSKRAIFAEPDSSLFVPGARLPFLVIEAAVSQTDRSLRTKAHHWIQGNGGHLKILCLLQLRRTTGPEGHRAVVTIIRPRKVPEPTVENPKHFRVEANHVFNEVEVFPTIPTGTFDVTLEDLLPKDAVLDASTSDKYVTISLEIFYDRVLRLVTMLDFNRSRGSSPFDPNQKEVPTPPDSSEDSETDEEEPQPDDSESEDPTFEVIR